MTVFSKLFGGEQLLPPPSTMPSISSSVNSVQILTFGKIFFLFTYFLEVLTQCPNAFLRHFPSTILMHIVCFGLVQICPLYSLQFSLHALSLYNTSIIVAVAVEGAVVAVVVLY